MFKLLMFPFKVILVGFVLLLMTGMVMSKTCVSCVVPLFCLLFVLWCMKTVLMGLLRFLGIVK